MWEQTLNGVICLVCLNSIGWNYIIHMHVLHTIYILIYWHIYIYKCQLALHPQVGAFYRCCSGPNPISLGPKVTFNCSTSKPPRWGKLPLRILWLRCQVKWNEGWQWQEGLWYVPEVPQWLRCAGGQKKTKRNDMSTDMCEGLWRYLYIIIPVHICAGRMCIYIYIVNSMSYSHTVR